MSSDNMLTASSSSLTISSSNHNSNNIPKEEESITPPRRPLSAYNCFYKSERARLLGIEEETTSDPKAAKRRKHRKTHGKFGFVELAKYMKEKWGNLDDASRNVYQKKSEDDRARYRQELKVWKKHQKTKTAGEGDSSSVVKGSPSSVKKERNDEFSTSMSPITEETSINIGDGRTGGTAAILAKALCVLNQEDEEEREEKKSSPVAASPRASAAVALETQQRLSPTRKATAPMEKSFKRSHGEITVEPGVLTHADEGKDWYGKFLSLFLNEEGGDDADPKFFARKELQSDSGTTLLSEKEKPTNRLSMKKLRAGSLSGSMASYSLSARPSYDSDDEWLDRVKEVTNPQYLNRRSSGTSDSTNFAPLMYDEMSPSLRELEDDLRDLMGPDMIDLLMMARL